MEKKSKNGISYGAVMCNGALINKNKETHMVKQKQEGNQPGRDEARESVKQWFRSAKFGMFIHWGVYSVTGRGEWLRSSEQVKEDEYIKQVPKFKGEKFDPGKWAALAKRAGMKYMVFTTKHHDGFCMFDAHNTDWKVTNSPVGRDVLADVTKAFEKEGIKVGYYYSIMDWHHPDYLPRMAFEAADRPSEGHDVMDYIGFMREHLKQILTEYGESPFVLWYDGGWMNAPEDLGAAETNALARQWKPGLLINDRHHTKEDLITPEQRVPATGIKDENGEPALWEACLTMTSHWWGYDKNEKNFKEKDYILRMLVDIVSKGGNFLLNVGPRPDGSLQREFVERLVFLGKWMDKYGEAIYNTTASPFNMLPFYGRVTVSGSRLYVHVFAWPKDRSILLPNLKNNVLQASVFGGRRKKLAFSKTDAGLRIELPEKATDATVSVIAVDLDGAPVVEPVKIVADKRGKIELPVLYGDLVGPHGQRIRYEIQDGCTLVGSWYRAPDRINWTFEAPASGEYRLEIEASTDAGEGGSHYEVYVNPQLRPALAPNGKPWGAEDAKRLFVNPPDLTYDTKSTNGIFRLRRLGVLKLEAGTNVVSIALKDAGGHKGMKLFAAKLVKC